MTGRLDGSLFFGGGGFSPNHSPLPSTPLSAGVSLFWTQESDYDFFKPGVLSRSLSKNLGLYIPAYMHHAMIA